MIIIPNQHQSFLLKNQYIGNQKIILIVYISSYLIGNIEKLYDIKYSNTNFTYIIIVIELLNVLDQDSLVLLVKEYGMHLMDQLMLLLKHSMVTHLKKKRLSFYKRQPLWVNFIIPILSSYME